MEMDESKEGFELVTSNNALYLAVRVIILVTRIQGTFGSYMNQPKHRKLLDL